MQKWLAVGVVTLAVACASVPPRKQTIDVPIPPPGRPMAELQAALESANSTERQRAAWALAGADADEVPAEVRTTLGRMREGDPDEQVRLAAVWAIGHIAKDPDDTKAAYDVAPRLLKQSRPVYPPEAFNKKIQGTVLVEVLIDEHGNVAHAEVRESVPGLDAAALETVRGWKFEPATKGGHVVATTASAPVTFRRY